MRKEFDKEIKKLMALKKKYQQKIKQLVDEEVTDDYIPEQASWESIKKELEAEKIRKLIYNIDSQIRAIKSKNAYAPVGRGKVRLRTGNDDQP